MMSRSSFDPRDRSATRWAVHSVCVQHNIHKFNLLNRHVFLSKVTPEMRTISIFYVIVRCVMSWNQNSSTVWIYRISAYFVFCWFSILPTNLHQLENSMEQVWSFVSPKWGSFDISDTSLTRRLSVSSENRLTAQTVFVLFGFSWTGNSPDMKWIWLFKERWPLNSIYIFKWYWNVMAAASQNVWTLEKTINNFKYSAFKWQKELTSGRTLGTAETKCRGWKSEWWRTEHQPCCADTFRASESTWMFTPHTWRLSVASEREKHWQQQILSVNMQRRHECQKRHQDHTTAKYFVTVLK